LHPELGLTAKVGGIMFDSKGKEACTKCKILAIGEYEEQALQPGERHF